MVPKCGSFPHGFIGPTELEVYGKNVRGGQMF
jgi:hypothetical protein